MSKKIMIVTALCTVFMLHAETLELDLETARKIALENNPSVKLAREGVEKSGKQVIETRANMMPSFSAFSNLQHAWELPTMILNLPPAMGGQQKFKMGTENNIVYGINYEQLLYSGGMIRNSYQISKFAYEIAESQLKTTEQSVLNSVTSAYYSVLFVQSALAVSEESLESAEENLAQVMKYYDVGKSSRFDVLRAEVQVANMKPLVVSAKNNLKLAESRLRMVLGITDTVEITYSEKLDIAYSELTEKPLDELIEIALRSRPEIMIMNKQKNIAQKQVSISRAAFTPKIALGTAYQYQGMRDDFDFTGDDFYKSFNSSISISIPLFTGLQNNSKYQQAKIAVKESEHQAESLINNIKLEVKGAYFTMQEALEKVQTQQKTIEQAKEAQRLARLMYSEGGSTQLDVLNANLAVQQAQMNYQQSLLEYNIALSNLKKAINQL